MSAFILGKAHIDALVTAALERTSGDFGPLSWCARDLTVEETLASYRSGAPWGPDAPAIGRALTRQATPDEAERIGQMLVRENRLSVNHRYRESEVEAIYTYERPVIRGRVDPVVILKAIDCYEYQSCEHPGWKCSEAHAFCRALRHRMICHLSGYEEAPWEIRSPREYLKTK